jgi:Methylamine utilisation protein MauE
MELALRIALAVVLSWAAIAKLARVGKAAETLAEHGIPQRARRPVAVLLALGELALAALLTVGIAPVATGLAVAALGTVFTAFLLRARVRGRTRTACGCFGGARSANTLLLTLRATALAASGAALAIGIPTIDPLTAEEWRTIAIGALGVVVVALTMAVLALYRQVGVLSLRLGPRTALELDEEGPPIGHPAPLLDGLNRRGSELVAFVSLNCRMCIEVVPGLRALAKEGIPVHWQREDTHEEIFERWGVPGTPFVVHIVDGIVRAKGLVNTLEQIDWVIDIGTERERLAA